MFWKRKPATPPAVAADRLAAVVSKPAPTEYAGEGDRNARRPRATVFKQAVAILPHGEKVPVVIKNLSVSGLRVEFFQNRTLGGRVMIEEPSLPIQKWADVVWEGDGAGGLKFDPPKPPAKTGRE
ncbi:MAG TPA: hypothetical protein VG942_16060 [Hyphomonadaceae bacterium]|nr:hypothetical protein [Hyphomonadaceae bacterium]